jgi:RNA polymerase sigma factor (sigma-70 family)
MSSSTSIDDAARQAIGGDREALERLMRALQSHIHGLALRMLWNREDAEDATQEILTRIATQLPRFEFRSRVETWAYRVAVNYILDAKKSAIERLHLSFERFAANLADGLEPAAPEDTERSILIEEVKVACTLAMLQCLDRPHRLAYVLGELMEISGPEAADAMDISPALFRKRLQHARRSVLDFTRTYCGLASDSAACRCPRRVSRAALADRGGGRALQFASQPISFEEARALVRRVDQARWAAEVHRSSRPSGSSVDLAQGLMDAFDRSRESGFSPDRGSHGPPGAAR